MNHTRIIRDFIDDPRRIYILARNRAKWHQLTSALDVVGDTDLALDAYSTGPLGQSEGERYLAIYGVLQALFVQQDAALNLCEALGVVVSLKEYPRLEEIREARNASTGHPTSKREKQGITSYHFVVRASIGKEGFNLLSLYSDGRQESKFIRVPELIDDQRRLIAEILSRVTKHLGDEERAHKEAFKMEKLATAFPQTLGHDFEKLFDGIEHANHRREFAKVGLKNIGKTLNEFEAALKRRGIELDTYDSIKYLYRELEYPLSRLEEYLGGGGVTLDREAARIFGWFIREKVRELEQIAKEIDQEYAE